MYIRGVQTRAETKITHRPSSICQGSVPSPKSTTKLGSFHFSNLNQGYFVISK